MKLYSFQPLFTKEGFAEHNCSFPVTSGSLSHRHRPVATHYSHRFLLWSKVTAVVERGKKSPEILTGFKLMTPWSKACFSNNSVTTITHTVHCFQCKKRMHALQTPGNNVCASHPSITACQRAGFAKPSKFVPGSPELTWVAIWGLENGKIDVSEGKRL